MCLPPLLLFVLEPLRLPTMLPLVYYLPPPRPRYLSSRHSRASTVFTFYANSPFLLHLVVHTSTDGLSDIAY